MLLQVSAWPVSGVIYYKQSTGQPPFPTSLATKMTSACAHACFLPINLSKRFTFQQRAGRNRKRGGLRMCLIACVVRCSLVVCSFVGAVPAIRQATAKHQTPNTKHAVRHAAMADVTLHSLYIHVFDSGWRLECYHSPLHRER